MKRKIPWLSIILVIAALPAMSFQQQQEKKPVYLYAYAKLSNSKTYVFTPVITCWYSKGGWYNVTNIMQIELRNRLEKYITGEMGYKVAGSYSVINMDLNKAVDQRLESMTGDRTQGYSIDHTLSSFSYEYKE